LKGRDQDRKKISMPQVPLSAKGQEVFKEGNI
jgi:NADH-quinone oxidoreductase subunit G